MLAWIIERFPMTDSCRARTLVFLYTASWQQRALAYTAVAVAAASALRFCGVALRFLVFGMEAKPRRGADVRSDGGRLGSWLEWMWWWLSGGGGGLLEFAGAGGNVSFLSYSAAAAARIVPPHALPEGAIEAMKMHLSNAPVQVRGLNVLSRLAPPSHKAPIRFASSPFSPSSSSNICVFSSTSTSSSSAPPPFGTTTGGGGGNMKCYHPVRFLAVPLLLDVLETHRGHAPHASDDAGETADEDAADATIAVNIADIDDIDEISSGGRRRGCLEGGLEEDGKDGVFSDQSAGSSNYSGGNGGCRRRCKKKLEVVALIPPNFHVCAEALDVLRKLTTGTLTVGREREKYRPNIPRSWSSFCHLLASIFQLDLMSTRT